MKTDKLILLAHIFDKRGYYSQASSIDRFIKTAFEMPFYHGTSSKMLHTILKEGLSAAPREKVWGENREVGELGVESYPGAYVSNSLVIAYNYAENAVEKFGGNMLIVAGKVETRSPQARIDEDLIDDPAAGLRDIEDIGGYQLRTDANILKRYITNMSDKTLEPYVRQYIEKELEIKPTEEIMKRAAKALRAFLDVRIALLLEKEKGYSSTGNDIFTETFGGSIPEKYKDPNKLVKEYRQAMDDLLAKAKELLHRDRVSKDKDLNVRLTENVGYKGKNKIEAIVEIIQGHNDEPDQIVVKYSNNPSAIERIKAAYDLMTKREVVVK